MELMLIATIVFGFLGLAAISFGADTRDMLDDPNHPTSHVGLG